MGQQGVPAMTSYFLRYCSSLGPKSHALLTAYRPSGAGVTGRVSASSSSSLALSACLHVRLWENFLLGEMAALLAGGTACVPSVSRLLLVQTPSRRAREADRTAQWQQKWRGGGEENGRLAHATAPHLTDWGDARPYRRGGWLISHLRPREPTFPTPSRPSPGSWRVLQLTLLSSRDQSRGRPPRPNPATNPSREIKRRIARTAGRD